MVVTTITSPADMQHGLTWQINQDSAFCRYFQATCAVVVLMPSQGIPVELIIVQLADCANAVITKRNAGITFLLPMFSNIFSLYMYFWMSWFNCLGVFFLFTYTQGCFLGAL